MSLDSVRKFEKTKDDIEWNYHKRLREISELIRAATENYNEQMDEARRIYHEENLVSKEKKNV